MSDVLLLLADTLVIFGAIGVGARIQARRARGPRPVVKNLVCGCDHVLAYHDPKTGECHASSKVGRRVARKNKSGADMPDTLYVEEIVECTCRVYTGDLPDDWYARTLGDSA